MSRHDTTLPDQWVVSAYAVVSWRGGRIEITSAASGATFTSDTLDLLRVLHAFARPRTIAEAIRELDPFAPQQLAAGIDDLIRGGVLTSASSPETAAAHHWDWSALALHRRSRQRGFQRSGRHRTPAVAAPRFGAAIPLPRGGVPAPRDLAGVLDARRSWRAWSRNPIGAETFSQLLWLSARDRAVFPEGPEEEYVSRPYPSGGAAYSLEIYAVIAAEGVESTAAGVYHYLPSAHALEPVTNDGAECLPFLDAAARSAGSETLPPVLLLVTSRFARQSETYGTLAYSLVLKEVGCLFQTLYLVAESLGLAPCALGGGVMPGRLARLCNTTELAEPVVGEFILGPR